MDVDARIGKRLLRVVLPPEPGDDGVDLDGVDVTDLADVQSDRRIRATPRADDQRVLELAGAEDFVWRAIERFLFIRRHHRLMAALVDVQLPAVAVVAR